MKINPNSFPLPLSAALVELLNKVLEQADLVKPAGLTLVFRDPNYAPLSGGYHPVEVSLAADGRLLYVTDFSYVGREPFVELAKELDFDSVTRRFQQFGYEYPLEKGRDMFQLWQENFCAYHAMAVYSIEIQQE